MCTHSFDHNKYLYAAGLDDGTVLLWDLRTMRVFEALNFYNNGHINSLCDFTYNGEHILCHASDNGFIYF